MKECPVCRVPLDEIPKYGVLIDICSSCRGIWLDRGELEKVLSLVGDPRDPYDRHRRCDDRRYDGHEHEDHYRHRKKRLSIFDIFDFD